MINFQDISNMLEVEPDEDTSQVQARYEIAYQKTLAFIKEHLESIKPQVEFGELGPIDFRYLDEISISPDLTKIDYIEVHFFQDRLTTIKSLPHWKIPASTVTFYPEVTTAAWNLIRPIVIQNGISSIIPVTLAQMLTEAGITGNMNVDLYYAEKPECDSY